SPWGLPHALLHRRNGNESPRDALEYSAAACGYRATRRHAPGRQRIHLLREINRIDPTIAVITVTGNDNVALAAEVLERHCGQDATQAVRSQLSGSSCR